MAEELNNFEMPDYEKIHPAETSEQRALKYKEAAMNGKLVLVTEGNAPNIELGISEVKKVVKAIKEIEEAREIIMADNKVTVGDFIGSPIQVIWEPATAIFDVIKSRELLAAQIVRIDTNEAEEIIAEVASEFNMLPGKVVGKISHAIKAAWHLGEIFKA